MCVLLVEDEAYIREVMAESLRDAGYEVIEVEDGVQAVAVIHDPSRAFIILVTDLHMPGGVDGSQVAAEVRATFPALPIVIATGRPEALQAAWQTELGYHLVKKPYRPSELVRLVHVLTG